MRPARQSMGTTGTRAIVIGFGLTMMIATFGPLLAAAQEKAAFSPIVALGAEPRIRLRPGARMALFLTGNDGLLTRLLEDAIGIHLTNAGFVLTSRESLERELGEQLAKRRKDKADSALSALEIGRALKVESIVTGTAIIAQTDKHFSVVKLASFQLLDVASEKTALAVVIESDVGHPLTDVSAGFVELLRRHLR